MSPGVGSTPHQSGAWHGDNGSKFIKHVLVACCQSEGAPKHLASGVKPPDRDPRRELIELSRRASVGENTTRDAG